MYRALEKTYLKTCAAAGKQTAIVWKESKTEPRALSDSVLYKLQVRSFTMHKSSGVRKKGTFQALEQKIPYLRELGVTAALLMPAYEYRGAAADQAARPAVFLYRGKEKRG